MYNFEYHVTIASKDQREASVWAEKNKWKLVALDLNGTDDIMLTKRVMLEENTPMSNLYENLLNDFPFHVIRIKIECPILYDFIPAIALKSDQYFETHIELERITEVELSLVKTCINLRWKGMVHLSRNKSKLYDNGSFNQMITIRNNHLLDIGLSTAYLLEDLDHAIGNHHQRKVQHEFVIFDSNLNHDSNWTKQNEEAWHH